MITPDARSLDLIRPVWLVDVEAPSGTLHFSTARLTVGGVQYEDYIQGIGALAEELRRADSSALNVDLPVRFLNEPYRAYPALVYLADALPFAGARVTVSEVFIDASGEPGEPEVRYGGLCGTPEAITPSSFTCRLTSPAFAADARRPG